MGIFLCTQCGARLQNAFAQPCACGFVTPVINGVYQLTKDADTSAAGDGLQWLGYDGVGENYEPAYFHDKDNDVIGNCDNLADFLGKGKVALDIGAGLGVSSIAMARSGLQVVAADISQVMLAAGWERAQKHDAKGIVFARMNGYKLPLASHSVDAVLEVDMLRQVDRPDIVISEIKRVLKPGGYLLQYGPGQSLGYTDAQAADNAKYNAALNDICVHYDDLLQAAGYQGALFSSWEQSEKCVKENFTLVKTIENTGAYMSNNRRWLLKWGLHKLKTRASGAKQLISNALHNTAWEQTHAYATAKYGNNYEDIARWYNSAGSMVALAQNE